MTRSLLDGEADSRQGERAMSTNEGSRSPRKLCLNCGLSCDGMFCCNWCLNAFIARRDAAKEALEKSVKEAVEKIVNGIVDDLGISSDVSRPLKAGR